MVILDNCSTDRSAELAAEAEVIYVERQGKDAVLRYVFREIMADIYVTADGDGVCPACAEKDLIIPLYSRAPFLNHEYPL
ncbi:MAG: hypothetical protein LBE65_05385 [Synergistaceae bacterium]|nr:hypothetical protein [Synergistaceae bacterium]